MKCVFVLCESLNKHRLILWTFGCSVFSLRKEKKLHTYIHICINTYIRTYIHTYIRTYLHTYILTYFLTSCFSDRASWIDYILITNLMHQLLFIHKIIFSSTCFELQVLIFRRIQLYTCSILYCHSLWEFLVACRYTAWVRTDCRGKVVGRAS